MKNRSRIKIYQLVVLITIVFTGFSCKDTFFKEQAGERITPEDHYKSLKDAEISLDGALLPLKVVMPNLIMVDGLRSDLMVPNPGRADAYLEAINNQSFTLDNPYIDASDYYKIIINVNEVLANIDKISALDRNFDKYLLFDEKGALFALRSWTYLHLARLYGTVAWINDNITKLPENLSQTMMTKDVLIDTLINQLIPHIYDPSKGVQRIEYSIHAYMNPKEVLGELYLEKNDYANAVIYLKMACESFSNTITLWKVDKSFTKEGWKTIFINAEVNSNERLSVIPFASTEGQINPLPRWLLYSDMYMVKPAHALVDSFKTQIPNQGPLGDIFRGVGISYDTIATGEPYISKYSLDKGEPYSTDIIISRATDVHLLLAEALNRSGDSKTALILLNSGFNAEKVKPAPYFKWSGNLGVRGRVLLEPKLVPDSINGEPLIDLARTEYVEDLIMNERALELAFEGKRWFDLVRVAKRRGNPDYLADKVAAKFADPAKAAQIRSLLLNEANWYLPYKK